MSRFTNALEAQERAEKATQRAQEQLKAEGHNYPLYDAKLSPSENYDRLDAYRKRESALITKLLNELPNPRPLVVDNVKPKQQWGKSYYDD